MLTPKILLRLEGLVAAAAAAIAYRLLGGSGREFALLILAPDLGMVAFAAGPRVGTLVYNLVHTYAAVGLVWLLGHFAQWSEITPVCLIWVVHIGGDRLLGFGLKYPSAFKATHLQRV